MRRQQQATYWMNETIRNSLVNHFYTNPKIEELLPAYEQKLNDKQISSFAAARALLNEYFNTQYNIN